MLYCTVHLSYVCVLFVCGYACVVCVYVFVCACVCLLCVYVCVCVHMTMCVDVCA